MQGRIVERVAADHVGLEIASAGPESDAVHIAAGLRQIENMLGPDERDVLTVGNPAVDLHAEARERIVTLAQRGTHTVESVDDQHTALFVRHAACRERFAREALTALVHSRHPVTVNMARLLLDDQIGFVDRTAVVEPSVVHTRIDHITRRRSALFQRVHHRTPRQCDVVGLRKFCGERLDGQRLHYIR